MCKTCGCKDAETLEGEDCGCKHENEAESFEATSDELDCPSCKATPKERMGEPLCSFALFYLKKKTKKIALRKRH